MKIKDSRRLYIYAGVLLLLVGGALRAVDSFVLSSGATKILASLTGPQEQTPENVVRQLMIETTSPKKVVTPPSWLGWACLSAGVVLTAHGQMLKWRK